MTEAVTELVVRGDGALGVLDRFEDKMIDAGQATDRSTGAIDRYNAAMAKFAAAQEQGIAITTQSVTRRTAEERAMERWQATLSKTHRLEAQLRREAERAAIDMANAVALGYTTPQHAVTVLTGLERRHAQQLRDSALAAKTLDNALSGANRKGAVVRPGAFNTANIAAQFQDIGVTAAMGMNPLQIALQQGTQLSAVFEQMKASGQSAASGLAAAFTSIISPLSLVTIGAIALVAAGLQMVDWAKLAASALVALAGALETIAPYAAMAAAGLALLYAPAIVMGIVQVIALLGRLAVSAVIAAGAMAAANPGVALVIGITAAVAALNIFRDEIERALGVDVVGVLKTVGNFIINSFRAAFADVQFIWEQLPAIMQKAATGAGNMLIAGFEVAINVLLPKIKAFYRAITPGAGIADAIGGKASEIWGTGLIPNSVSFGRLDPGGGADFDAANAKHAANIKGIMGSDPLGDFGAGISRGASTATEKLKELAKWMTTVDDKKKKGRGGKTDEEKYQDIIDGADRRIASLLAEQDALGMTEEAAAALRYEQDLLNQAQQKGIELTPQQAAYMKMLAETMAGIEAATKRAREAMAFAKSLTKGFIDDFRNGLEQGKSIWESFANAALNALDKIVDKLLNDVLDALFKVNNAGSGGGGIWGWLGSLFGFGGGGGFGSNGLTPIIDILGGASVASANPAAKAMQLASNLTAVRMPANQNTRALAAPTAQARPTGQTAAAQHLTFDMKVTVSGTGDKELQERLQKATEVQMEQALTHYDREVLPHRVNQIASDPHGVG